MSEIDLIKGKIAETEAKIKKAETKLEQLEESEENEATIKKWEERRDRLEALLTEQQKKENLLLASQGKTSIICSHSSFFALFLSFPVYYHPVFCLSFQLLSLHIALSNPIPSTFMIHMMPHNV